MKSPSVARRRICDEKKMERAGLSDSDHRDAGRLPYPGGLQPRLSVRPMGRQRCSHRDTRRPPHPAPHSRSHPNQRADGLSRIHAAPDIRRRNQSALPSHDGLRRFRDGHGLENRRRNGGALAQVNGNPYFAGRRTTNGAVLRGRQGDEDYGLYTANINTGQTKTILPAGETTATTSPTIPPTTRKSISSC